MRIIKIEANPSGSHEFRFAKHITSVPDGWAMIPEDFELPDTFPFVSLEVKEKTVVGMIAGEVPPAPVYEPTAAEDTAAMLIDHEYRLTLLELGLSE